MSNRHVDQQSVGSPSMSAPAPLAVAQSEMVCPPTPDPTCAASRAAVPASDPGGRCEALTRQPYSTSHRRLAARECLLQDFAGTFEAEGWQMVGLT